MRASASAALIKRSSRNFENAEKRLLTVHSDGQQASKREEAHRRLVEVTDRGGGEGQMSGQTETGAEEATGENMSVMLLTSSISIFPVDAGDWVLDVRFTIHACLYWLAKSEAGRDRFVVPTRNDRLCTVAAGQGHPPICESAIWKQLDLSRQVRQFSLQYYAVHCREPVLVGEEKVSHELLLRSDPVDSAQPGT